MMEMCLMAEIGFEDDEIEDASRARKLLGRVFDASAGHVPLRVRTVGAQPQ